MIGAAKGSNASGRPILVTGSHRSGTGWVGQMLAASTAPAVAYLWEPFSVLHRPGICNVGFPYWFPYVCRENERTYVRAIGDMLAFRYRPLAELRAVRTPRDAARLARDWRRMVRYRRLQARPLMKDPIALFSSEWLCDTFDMDVVLLIRHPAAFVHSLTTRGWSHPFNHFLHQPLLMRDFLAPFEAEIERFAEEPQPIPDQAILLWNILHDAILRYRERRPNWLFLRLEDIAHDPVASFRHLYDALGLGFNQHAADTIISHSNSSNPSEQRDASSTKRDSRASVSTWKTRLSSEEIARIRVGVEPIASEFYTDADW